MPRSHRVHQPAALRVKALLLLAVFLAAGTTFPGLDALLFHRNGPDLEGSRIHLEPAGPCPGHAAHCTLGRPAPGSGAISASTPTIRMESHVPASRPLPPALPAFTPTREILAQPRAPPVPTP